MAREFATVRLNLWASDAFRALTPRAQHLHFLLLTSASLSFCGVADWRPKRLAALSAGNSPSSIEQAAEELQGGGFIAIDEGTEEVLIVNFITDDGLMKQPNMAVAMVSAYTGVASARLRALVAEEVRTLSVERPELACWGAKASKDALAKMIEQASGNPSGNPSINPSANPSGNPSVHPSDDPSRGVQEPFPGPSRKGSGNPSPTTAPAPSSNTSTSTAAAGAAARPPADGLFDVGEKPETEGQRVNRLTRIYTDLIKLTSFHAVSGVVKAAVRAQVDGVRQYSDTQIADALRELAEERRTVTQNSLRIAMEGMPAQRQQMARPAAPAPGAGVWDRVVTREEPTP
jgi:hypothetical protein